MSFFSSRRRSGRPSRLRRWVLRATLVLVIGGGLFYLGLRTGWRWDAEMTRMGCDQPIGDVAALAPVPKDPNVLRFLAVGDTGTGTVGQAQVAQAMARVCERDGCDFVLMLGDNVYPNGVSGLDDPKFESHIAQVYGPLGIPIYPVLGNHDIRQPALSQVLYTLVNPQWRMPNYRYAFSTGLASFHAVNTNCNVLAWHGLADNMEQSGNMAAPWRIVFGHHALYSTGVHGGADPVSRHIWQEDIAEGVDFYLSGHNHILEHLSLPGQRAQYVVSGAGGWHGPTGNKPHPTTESGATTHFRTDNGGFAYFALTRTQALLRFHDGEGQTVYEYLRKRP